MAIDSYARQIAYKALQNGGGGGGTGAVDSVNGKTGTVVLTTNDIADNSVRRYVKDEEKRIWNEKASKEYVDEKSLGFEFEDESMYIKKVIGSGEPHIYSTEEQIVGLWIDGVTPIYERVILGSTSNGSTTWGDTDIDVSNYDEVLVDNLIIKFENGIKQIDGAQVKIENNTISIFQQFYSSNTQYDYLIKIRYTKI